MVSSDPVAPTALVLYVKGDVDVDTAGVVVDLQVEGLRHVLGGGREAHLHPVVVAPGHVLADVRLDIDGVVGSYLEILDGQLHRVVTSFDERVAPPGGALPVAIRVLLAHLEPFGPVGLAVAVVVPVVVPALVAVTHVLALVEVIVVPDLLPLYAVVCQRERGRRLLAWAHVSEMSHQGGIFPPCVVRIVPDHYREPLIAIRLRDRQPGPNRVVL